MVTLHTKSNMYLCRKHRTQLSSHGYFLEKTPHSKYDRNEIINKGDYSIIITRDKRYRINGQYIVDTEDVKKVENIRWRPDSKGYAHNNSDRNNNIYLHHVILPPKDNEFVDHINKNKADNRKSNLRLVTHQKNNINSSKRCDNTSGVIGVCHGRSNDKWRSRIVFNGQEINLAYTTSFDEAVKARIKGEARYFKEYSPNYNQDTNTLQLKYLSHDDYKETFIEVDMEGNIVKFIKMQQHINIKRGDIIKQRGFKKISEGQFNRDFKTYPVNYLDIIKPKRATAKSAGYDVYAPFDIELLPNEDIVVPTGVKSYMLDDEVLFALPRSGHGFKYYIRLANTQGVIDADFFNNPNNEGHIFIKIRNEGSKHFVIKKGEAFCQFIFQKYLLADNDDFTGEERKGGIGSTNNTKI